MRAQTSARSIRDALYEEPGPKTRRRMLIGTIISSVVVVVVLALIVRQFYIKGQLDAKYWSFFTRVTTWSFLLQGFMGTITVSLSAGALALVLGLLLMLGRTSGIRILEAICRVVTNFFRGVPSLLLIYFFFIGLPNYGIHLQPYWMIMLPVAFAASGVLAEVFRAGVNAVPKGQSEAALSLGMTKWQTMFKIVLPQAIRYIIPSLISQLVVVVKDTTVAYVVSYPDLLQNARVLITNYNALVSTYFVVAIIYILLNYAINQLAIYVARREGVSVVPEASQGPA